MAQDVRPFRTGAVALLLLAAAILGAGIWAELQAPLTDPIASIVTGRLVPLLQAAPFGQSQTTFGTLANLAGVIGLTGLLLFTLRRPATAAPAAAAPVAPRVMPRRPADLRAARAGGARAPAAPQPEPTPAPVAPAPRRTGRQFQRAALMLIGSALIGLGALYALGQANLPVPAFTPPGQNASLLQPALIVAGLALGGVAVLRLIRRRRSA